MRTPKHTHTHTHCLSKESGFRMSCNGCRVLRKGCNEDCVLRPCLEWITSPQSQANATLFLAKFYGRAGLLNLITAAPLHHRPAIFRSLLYEACGRIINPVYASVGLMSSGSWEQCQFAVDSVLNGSAIMQLSSDQYHMDDHDNAAAMVPLHNFIPAMSLIKGNCDIRHLSKVPGNFNINHDPIPICKRSKRGKAIESPNEPSMEATLVDANRDDVVLGTCTNESSEVVLDLTLGRI